MSTLTTDPLDALLGIRDGYPTARWNFPAAVGTLASNPGGIGAPVALTYTFLSAAPAYYAEAGLPVSGFVAFNTAQKTATRSVLAHYSEVIGATFTSRATGGQIAFGMDAQTPGVASGYGWFPSYGYITVGPYIEEVFEGPVAGDVWLNSNYAWRSAEFNPGGVGYETLIHEMGHALGLKHPFETDSDGFILDPNLDNLAYTIMSYTPHPSSAFSFTGPSGFETRYVYPSTLMPYDIAALQYLYGSNPATRAGDDLYTFDPFNPTIETIWDGGGVDTLSVANFLQGCDIDLRAGGYSSINPGLSDGQPLRVDTDNLAIAFGVTIENAIGGAGGDYLLGNSVANRLDGGGGADTLEGEGGSDKLYGGGGSDYLTGGPRRDVLTGGNGGDLLRGEAGNDLLKGGSGRDTLTGGDGVDAFRFDTAPNASTNLDRITDFALADDRIELDDKAFTALGPTGPLAASAFGALAAPNALTRVLYDVGTGGLYYDADGSGAAAPVQFARVTAGLALTAVHFAVV